MNKNDNDAGGNNDIYANNDSNSTKNITPVLEHLLAPPNINTRNNIIIINTNISNNISNSKWQRQQKHSNKQHWQQHC